MVGNWLLIHIKPAFLALIFVIIPTVILADDIKSSTTDIVNVESRKDNKDLEKALTDSSPIPDWLSAVLNWLPPENHDLKTAAVEEEDLSKEIGQSFTSPKKQEHPVRDGIPISFHGILPLYTSPKIDGEGVWESKDTPVGSDGTPLVYKTVYRPSVEFPNSVVYMALFDMSRLKPRLFIGQTEPGIYQISDTTPRESLSRIVAITNAMWMQQHARGAGAIFRGKVIYPMVPGMATLVVYQDDSVDVLEWSNDIPLSSVKDARQLRHLILKDGKVVNKVIKNGKVTDSEIGLGGFLIDNDGSSTMNKEYWYLANRTAFGIRDDGNLVFAMGHHVSTKDLARALALAGCTRAIHGDANIHNIVCNFYFRDENNKIVKRDRLSPEQLQYTMKRYDQGYAKDFFAFYEK
ncbi:MAG: phosphodiester glycosidase family protein [Deltaproteobacteria bacterium]|nr:phosphodiester glycosidase family protein [Deltaproteobacteria bacterium]